MNRLLLLVRTRMRVLLRKIILWALGDRISVEVLHAQQVLVGRDRAGANDERWHIFTDVTSEEAAKCVNVEETHVDYKDEQPAPANARWKQIRGKQLGVVIASSQPLDKVEGMAAGVAQEPGEDVQVAKGVGATFFAGVGDERVAIRSHVAAGGKERIGLRANAPIQMIDEEGKKHTGFTGIWNGGRYDGGVFLGPADE